MRLSWYFPPEGFPVNLTEPVDPLVSMARQVWRWRARWRSCDKLRNEEISENRHLLLPVPKSSNCQKSQLFHFRFSSSFVHMWWNQLLQKSSQFSPVRFVSMCRQLLITIPALSTKPLLTYVYPCYNIHHSQLVVRDISHRISFSLTRLLVRSNYL